MQYIFIEKETGYVDVMIVANSLEDAKKEYDGNRENYDVIPNYDSYEYDLVAIDMKDETEAITRLEEYY